jgi:transposase
MTTQAIERIEVDMDELESIVERARREPLDAEGHRKLKAALETLGFLTQELESKNVSLKRLRGLLFGAPTEKLENVLPDESTDSEDEASSDGDDDDDDEGDGHRGAEKPRPKGHGRNGAAKYTGAERVEIPHESLKPGDGCPNRGCRGKVYRQKPSLIVRMRGQAPLQGKIYELERLRCNLCGQVFRAKAPAEIGERKYDETAAAMIGLLKYGSGLPFNRLQRLEGNLGIPLPAATQWEIVNGAGAIIGAAYGELIRQAAQGDIFHNDDTKARILALMGKRREKALVAMGLPADSQERAGLFTSGIVSLASGVRIALFFTGRKHAGENLERVLAERNAELTLPIQMCDALAQNTCGDFETILGNCNSHARRQFVDVSENFPAECRHVLETFSRVYKNDFDTREGKLSPEDRLAFHRKHSRPLMVKLAVWFRKKLAEKSIEPNSALGRAIAYLKKHWQKLTLFYRKPGAPIDNNIVERALKKAILHRKNAMFFKTENGARVADLFMSLIYSAELSGTNPFDYLVELQRHSSELSENPAEWMPWNYRETLERLAEATA